MRGRFLSNGRGGSVISAPTLACPSFSSNGADSGRKLMAQNLTGESGSNFQPKAGGGDEGVMRPNWNERRCFDCSDDLGARRFAVLKQMRDFPPDEALEPWEVGMVRAMCFD